LLIFIGLKLVAHNYLKDWGYQPEWSLYIIAFIMLSSITISVLIPVKPKPEN